MRIRSWRHVKHPEDWYHVECLATLEKDLTPVVVYKNEAGKVWVRPLSEFMDGRFEWLNCATLEWEKPEVPDADKDT
ncbi:DUF1653 domain-containing protein [bacterium]|nr:MAG: DUF1653 domain-containing protein [bacterium]